MRRQSVSVLLPVLVGEGTLLSPELAKSDTLLTAAARTRRDETHGFAGLSRRGAIALARLGKHNVDLVAQRIDQLVIPPAYLIWAGNLGYHQRPASWRHRAKAKDLRPWSD
jgi:hypothetical protein